MSSDTAHINESHQDEDFAQICEDHKELKLLLGEIRNSLSKRLGTVARVAEMLGQFCDIVETHFDGEEIGGFFDQIVEKAPRLSRSVDEIKGDHAQLRQTIHALLSATKDSDSSDWWKDMEHGFKDFSDSLMKHEESERQLLQDAFWQDTGAQD